MPLDDFVGRTAFFFGDMDCKLTQVAALCIRPGDTVLDVGANLGVVSLHLAKLVGARGTVHAFEPSPRALPFLKRTFQDQPHLPVKIHEIAAGAADDEIYLNVPEGNAGQGSFIHHAGRAAADRFMVPVRPLRSVLKEEQTGKVSFVKIDVESYEAEVLEGLLNASQLPPPSVIVMEDFEGREGRAQKILRSFEYDIFGIRTGSAWRARLVASDRPGFDACSEFVAVHRESGNEARKRLKI
ncbi:FkbM family methyltransferase [Rhodobaculum claviforme]|uniref:FkbM family methyltransferase n=1 Tax=Rhodobaculum claviforme TaxID=1549854 RepID=UPI0019148EED